MAMLDYPYSTHFMGNMPANPVKVYTQCEGGCTKFLCLSVDNIYLGDFNYCQIRGGKEQNKKKNVKKSYEFDEICSSFNKRLKLTVMYNVTLIFRWLVKPC